MNIFAFILFLVGGFVGCNKNIRNKKTGQTLNLIFFCLFILCGISRIGHTYDYSDLTYYIDYFENDISTYFEPGYLFFTELIKLFGQNGYVLVLSVGLFIVLIISISSFLLERKVIRTKNTFFIFCFLFFVYWGLAFEAERIRIGMATSLLVLSTTLAFCRYRYIPYVFAILAILFHFTTIIYVPVIWFIQKDFKLLTRQFYYIWLVCLACFDFFTVNFKIFNSLFIFKYVNLLSIEQISHYSEYEVLGESSYSLQYLWYHIAPLCFYIGNFKCKYFNNGVFIYFIGLTFSSLMQSIPAGHRIADMFEIMIIFPLVFMLATPAINKKSYRSVVCLYIIVQAIMCARYLSISY